MIARFVRLVEELADFHDSVSRTEGNLYNLIIELAEACARRPSLMVCLTNVEVDGAQDRVTGNVRDLRAIHVRLVEHAHWLDEAVAELEKLSAHESKLHEELREYVRTTPAPGSSSRWRSHK